ncbi:MAG TPA: cyclase family protein [Pyrinomonadaceae bacterium]
MIFSVEINNQIHRIDMIEPLDIAIPLDFSGAQPNAYGVEKAVSKPCEAGALVGDTRRGGSCNFEQITLIPHCNGTHTESVGHITNERISVHECLRDAFVPATLVSVEPENAGKTNESYSIRLNENDRLITRKSLEKALKNADENFLRGLIVRTMPNDADKLTQTYLKRIPPFFSTEAMEFITAKNVNHLLVDTPSIDRIFDEGKLGNHRVFWNIEKGSYELNQASFPNKTITEMIYASDEIADGAYLLNLQIAPLVADASPSRPILFKLLR